MESVRFTVRRDLIAFGYERLKLRFFMVLNKSLACIYQHVQRGIVVAGNGIKALDAVRLVIPEDLFRALFFGAAR